MSQYSASALQVVGDWGKTLDRSMSRALAASMGIIGRSGEQACQHAIILMAESARAATPQSPKLRKIVRNPDERYKTDARIAPWGVMKYGKDGTQRFQPIYRTGEYGRVRFVDKKTFEVKYINTLTGKVERAERYDQTPELSIATDKRREIRRRGLAKSAWMWGLRAFGKSVKTPQRPMSGAYAVFSIKGAGGKTHGYALENRLRYILKIMERGWEARVETAAANKVMWQAADKMRKEWARRMNRPIEAAETLSMADLARYFRRSAS